MIIVATKCQWQISNHKGKLDTVFSFHGATLAYKQIGLSKVCVLNYKFWNNNL